MAWFTKKEEKEKGIKRKKFETTSKVKRNKFLTNINKIHYNAKVGNT